MSKRRWTLLAFAALVAAGCNGCDDDEEPDQKAVNGPTPTTQLVGGGCELEAAADSILTWAQAATYDTASGWSDTTTLRPNGPRARIALNVAYDTLATYDPGAVVARITSLDSTPFPRMNLAPGGTSYVWAQTCGSQIHIYYVGSNGTVGQRAPAWVDHAHSNPAGVFVQFRDTTITGQVDSLIASGMLDSATAVRIPADTSAGEGFVTYSATAICGRCSRGWCTGV
jgi:hypothetical protein